MTAKTLDRLVEKKIAGDLVTHTEDTAQGQRQPDISDKEPNTALASSFQSHPKLAEQPRGTTPVTREMELAELTKKLTEEPGSFSDDLLSNIATSLENLLRDDANQIPEDLVNALSAELGNRPALQASNQYFLALAQNLKAKNNNTPSLTIE
jgi:hypothetical protein